uniref:Uncharacterized protein n=1 Tax=Nelumbo nucifera TaxID=4432 RepID=A0A822Y1E8_NELNU|nr:TPA_asm: hypothetical protein HUJ06_027755 [Nelumbo nucifera]
MTTKLKANNNSDNNHQLQSSPKEKQNNRSVQFTGVSKLIPCTKRTGNGSRKKNNL